MKYPLRIAMVCFLISVAIMLGFYATGKTVYGSQISGLWNMFLLVCSIGLSVYFTKRSKGFDTSASFSEDFKVALQGGIVFVVLISVFTYVFHEKIDNSFIEKKMNERLDANLENVPNEAAYVKLQAEDPVWKNKSYLDYIENQEDQASLGLSAYSFALGHLGIGLFLALFFSIAVTFIWRKIVMMDS